jgi:hypothetical protein
MVDIREKFYDEEVIYIHCSCDGEDVTMLYIEEDEWDLAFHHPYLRNWWERLKFAFGYMLRKNYYCIVLSRYQVEKLYEAIGNDLERTKEDKNEKD